LFNAESIHCVLHLLQRFNVWFSFRSLGLWLDFGLWFGFGIFECYSQSKLFRACNVIIMRKQPGTPKLHVSPIIFYYYKLQHPVQQEAH